MAKKVLSIVIGAECTKVCEVSNRKNYKNKGIKVYRSASFATPPNVIEDGYIKDKAAFGEVLKSQLRTGKFKSDKVVFSVTSSKIANREVLIPPIKGKRIMDIIKTGASEYFPIDVKDYILSYTILDKNTSSGKEKLNRKKQDKKELKLAKKLEKQNKKALKKKSKTEIIADNMELMEAKRIEEDSPEAFKENSPEVTNNTKKQMRLSVYAAPSTLIKNYYSFAKLMHLDITAIDYSGNSSYQAIKRQAKRGTNVFVQMNTKDTLISILRDDILILQRTVSFGLSTMVEAVLEQDIYQSMSYEEALEILTSRNMLSLELEDGRAFFSDPAGSLGEAAVTGEYTDTIPGLGTSECDSEFAAKKNIRESLHILSNSIARMLDYYKSSHKKIDIETIYLTGSGVHIKGIEDYFTTEIGISHKNMEKLFTYSAKKKAASYRNNPSEFLTCAGAVIKPVDFVPIEFTLKKEKRSLVIATVIFCIVCLAGTIGTVYVSFTDYSIAKKELDQIEAEYDAMPALSGAHGEYDIAVKELEDLQDLEALIESNNDNIKDVLIELENKLPKQTIIHSMQFTETDVTMNVTCSDSGAGSNALVAVVYRQLKTIKYFEENVKISGINVEEVNGVSLVNFTIQCTYIE